MTILSWERIYLSHSKAFSQPFVNRKEWKSVNWDDTRFERFVNLKKAFFLAIFFVFVSPPLLCAKWIPIYHLNLLRDNPTSKWTVEDTFSVLFYFLHHHHDPLIYSIDIECIVELWKTLIWPLFITFMIEMAEISHRIHCHFDTMRDELNDWCCSHFSFTSHALSNEKSTMYAWKVFLFFILSIHYNNDMMVNSWVNFYINFKLHFIYPSLRQCHSKEITKKDWVRKIENPSSGSLRWFRDKQQIFFENDKETSREN